VPLDATPRREEIARMLARRFTIVCLLITLFGMGLSILVAEKSMTQSSNTGGFFACDATNIAHCPARMRR
jgi:hypothetical protein